MACGSFFWERLPRLDGLRRGSRRHRMEALLQEEGLPSSPVRQEEDLPRQALESLPRSRWLEGDLPEEKEEDLQEEKEEDLPEEEEEEEEKEKEEERRRR